MTQVNAKPVQLYGAMHGALSRDVASADGKRRIAAGTRVEFQLAADTTIVVVDLSRPDAHVIASLREVAGSELR